MATQITLADLAKSDTVQIAQSDWQRLYDARDAALRVGDADAWHAADAELRAFLSYHRAQVRLGLTDWSIPSAQVAA
jgi:hypothetical protein